MIKYIFITLLFPVTCFAQVTLPAIFGDGMVLQQKTHAPIWGKDKPGVTIMVTTSWNKSSSTIADEKGYWKLKIPTPTAGGPYSLMIEGSDNIKLTNVYIGEVWICSGQSNMDRSLLGRRNEPVEGSAEMIANSKNDRIRFFTVKKNASKYLANDVRGNWISAQPANAGEFSAVAYSFAKKIQQKLNVPVGMVVSAWGGSSIEAWMDSISIIQQKDIVVSDSTKDNRKPGYLYNGMIAPLIGMSVKGIIWYQGEANVPNADTYERKFSNLIQSWRTNWKIGPLPFYFVQIAPYNFKDYESGKLRDAQMRVVKTVANTGMAVTLDIGSCKTLHPPKKREVGERLAYWALGKTYKVRSDTISGPILKSILKKSNGAIEISFDFAQKGLRISDNKNSGFELAGSDGIYYPADIVVGSNSITVKSSLVNNPVNVRYGYANCTDANLFNSAGLPAGSFISDLL